MSKWKRTLKNITMVIALFSSAIFITTTSYAKRHQQVGSTQVGSASYYSYEFNQRLTANGERFNPKKLTAAHRTLPFGTRIKVTNLSNMKSIICVINDRGPFVRGRILDVSFAAAKVIGMVKSGTAKVSVKIIS